MVSEFDPKYYFNLSDFAHRELFHGVSEVWSVLQRLKVYFETLDLGKIEGEVSPDAYLVNPELISIGEGTVVEPGAYIKGPCVLGSNCTVRHGAYIRGHVLAGDHCVIGHATEVKHSIFLNKAQAAHFAYVGDSILGGHCNLGAGCKCANLKLDGREVGVFHNGQRHGTGLRKFGAIIGDGAQLGCNSVTNPGTLMGQKAFCLPCTSVSGFLPSGKCVRAK